MSDEKKILVINPGSTSTKLAYFVGEKKVHEAEVEHPPKELAAFGDIPSQERYRMAALDAFMEDNGIEPSGLDAVAARGGLMKPVAGGVYKVSAGMVADLKRSKARWGREHASNLGAMLALSLSRRYGIPAFTADPVTVDEMDEVARVSGVPEITRKSHLHALNIKACVRRACGELGLKENSANFVVAHIGGGISVAAVRRGKIVDTNNALLGMGPFSPQRAGALPTGDLVALAMSGKYDRAALERKLAKKSGLMGYLGTSDIREVQRRIKAGDEKAELVFDAMAYQIAKEIGAMAGALSGKADAVIITGGGARSRGLVGMLRRSAGFVARVVVYPGGSEMEALAGYALAALTGNARVKTYG